MTVEVQCKKINISNNRKKILEAVELLSDPVKRTLGPEGLPILLQREGDVPLNTKDGVTVAKSIFVQDQELDSIIQAIKEASVKTNREAGDGTTTAVVLAESFIKEGFKLIEMDVVKPQSLCSSIKKKVDEVSDWLKEIAKPINSEADQKDVALISANGDDEVAGIVVEAINKAGEDGTVTIDEGASSETQIYQVAGFELDSGFFKLGSAGFEFITNEERQMAICEHPEILMYNGNLTDLNDFAIFLRKYTNDGEKTPPALVVVAHDFTGEVLNYFLDMRKKHWPIFPVKTTILGSKTHASRALQLNDLAVFTGGERIAGGPHALSEVINEAGYAEKYIGHCSKVEISSEKTIFYDGACSLEAKGAYLQILKKIMDSADNDWDRMLTKKRMGRINNGVVVIYVGGRTELELREKKDRVEDAYNAVRAAVLEGVVPGGGCALYFVSQMFKGDGYIDNLFKKVLQSPIRQIYENAGLPSDVILDRIGKEMIAGNREFGYNVRTNEYCQNMFDFGIVDPLKVVRCALYNAVSIATQMLMSGGVISFDDYVVNKKEKIYT